MAKKHIPTEPAGATEPPAQVRKQIQRIDRELLRLFNERARLARQGVTGAADAPSEEWLAECSNAEWLDRALATDKGPLDAGAIRATFRELISGCRALLRPARVVYLGPEYSFSHLAAVEQFGRGAELIPAATIAAVFDALSRHQAQFGLVPIENSTDGRVADTLDMFARLPLRICGEVQLRIHHCLLGKCARAEVQEVYSKPQALSQCRTWLANHLPQARVVEMASTAVAAKLAADKPHAAAIASRQAAAHYQLDIIDGNIEDNRHNVTRFAVIGDRTPRRTGDDKTALMFELPHQPGALADAMAIFKRQRLNLTWIESFPMPDTPNEYLFFVEFQGHPAEARAKRALASLQRKTVRLEVLGSYPAGRPVD